MPTKSMNVLKSIIRNTVWKWQVSKAIKNSSIRKSLEGNADRKVIKAIREAVKKELSTEEKAWINRIENLRKSLSCNTANITITDFGAGDPESNRSEKEMREGIVHSATIASISQASKPPFWALILFKLVREFKPRTILELGTCLGISASYQAAAQSLNGEGQLITMEGAAALASLSKENFQSLGLDKISVITGPFHDNLNSVLSTYQPIDYVFIDGHHDEKATISYFETILPFLSNQSIVIFDDISWSKGMRTAWNTIIENQQIKMVIDCQIIGICVIEKEN